MAVVWRVFPWDDRAPDGALFSAAHVPTTTGRGRFDLPVELSPVLYLAESPEHAVAELLQPWRNRALERAHLVRAGHPLALVGAELPDGAGTRLLDLCDPGVLADSGWTPDRVASRHRRLTQPIAAEAWRAGCVGLRWWSAFWGDWHGVVLFTARIGDRLDVGEPVALTRESPSVVAAADALGMTVPRSALRS